MAAENSFLDVRGDYPLTRLFDFLLTFDDLGYSLAEIAENAGVDYYYTPASLAKNRAATISGLHPKGRKIQHAHVKQEKSSGAAID